MAEMGAVLDLHSDPALLEAAARTYLSLCGEETPWCSTAQTARDSLVQGWVDRLTALLEDSFKVNYTIWPNVCGQFVCFSWFGLATLVPIKVNVKRL